MEKQHSSEGIHQDHSVEVKSDQCRQAPSLVIPNESRQGTGIYGFHRETHRPSLSSWLLQGEERQDTGEIAEVSLEEDKEEVEDIPI